MQWVGNACQQILGRDSNYAYDVEEEAIAAKCDRPFWVLVLTLLLSIIQKLEGNRAIRTPHQRLLMGRYRLT